VIDLLVGAIAIFWILPPFLLAPRRS